MTRNVWTVILAAGAGRRLAPVTGPTPKQFWKNGLAPSLLEDTVSRMAPIAPPGRTLVVVDRSHVKHLESHRQLAVQARLLYQPQNRGTAVGVLFAIEPVLDRDPGAIVVLTPSDHGVADETGFRRGILEAVRHLRSRGGIVLFGAEPTDSNDDFGWIVKHGHARGSVSRLFHVERFVEKPPPNLAEALLKSGAIWNTMVLVARARDLQRLFLAATPQLVALFDDARRLPLAQRAAFYAAAYPHLPALDFSHHVLGAADDLLAYEWPAALGWSDLGTPDRLARWHARHERQAALGAA